jgi:hypothetical protein
VLVHEGAHVGRDGVAGAKDPHLQQEQAFGIDVYEIDGKCTS